MIPSITVKLLIMETKNGRRFGRIMKSRGQTTNRSALNYDVSGWISRDPIASSPPYLGINPSHFRPHMGIGELAVGPNLYEYVDNDPVGEIDPFGKQGAIAIGGEIGSGFGPIGTVVGIGIGIGITYEICHNHNDDVKKREKECNEDFEAEYSVCGKLPEPYRTKCEQDAFDTLDKCLRAARGGWF